MFLKFFENSPVFKLLPKKINFEAPYLIFKFHIITISFDASLVECECTLFFILHLRISLWKFYCRILYLNVSLKYYSTFVLSMFLRFIAKILVWIVLMTEILSVHEKNFWCFHLLMFVTVFGCLFIYLFT